MSRARGTSRRKFASEWHKWAFEYGFDYGRGAGLYHEGSNDEDDILEAAGDVRDNYSSTDTMANVWGPSIREAGEEYAESIGEDDEDGWIGEELWDLFDEGWYEGYMSGAKGR